MSGSYHLLCMACFSTNTTQRLHYHIHTLHNIEYEAIRLFSSKASPFTSHYEFMCSTCKLIFCVLHFYVVGAFDKGNVS